MLSVIMLRVVMLNVANKPFVLSVVMLGVVAPNKRSQLVEKHFAD
jgi:hypothetical protein